MDPQGKELWSHWREGSGERVVKENGEWGSYKMANRELREQLSKELSGRAVVDAIRLRQRPSTSQRAETIPQTKVPYLQLRSFYRTGYDLLSGPNNREGGFTYSGTVTEEGRLGDCIILRYDLHYTWNDKIDANKSHRADQALSFLATGAYPSRRDYQLSISWDARSYIIVCGRNVGVGWGFPFDRTSAVNREPPPVPNLHPTPTPELQKK